MGVSLETAPRKSETDIDLEAIYTGGDNFIARSPLVVKARTVCVPNDPSRPWLRVLIGFIGPHGQSS